MWYDDDDVDGTDDVDAELATVFCEDSDLDRRLLERTFGFRVTLEGPPVVSHENLPKTASSVFKSVSDPGRTA